MKNNIQTFLTVVASLALVVLVAWAGFWMQRTFNYNMFYKAQVEQQVDMILQQRIKTECFVGYEE